MATAIAEPRKEVSEYAPKMVTFNIPTDKIRDVIGKGGEQINKIIEISNSNPEMSIGVLLPSNQQVIEVCEKLKSQNFDYEFKFKTDAQDKRAQGELNFTNNLPKIMTYHSAKGLQFDIVILPLFEGANNDETKKALYVAMTRTMHHLYLMYNTPNLAPPLDKVPPRLYKKN